MGFIRTALAISVLAFHSGSLFNFDLPDGVVAVQSFYVISGFYMGLVLKERYSQNLFLFYRNRFLKIFPLYFIVLIAFIIFLDKKIFWNSAITNILIIGQALSYFINREIASLSILEQAWSLDLEITFYLLAPFFVRQKTPVLMTIIIISCVLRHIFYVFGYSSDPWNYRFFPFEIAFFLLGVLSFRAYTKYIQLISPLYMKYISYSFLLLDLFLICNYSDLMGISPIHEYYGNVFRWIFVLLISLSIPFVFFISKNSKFDSFVGEFSYPVYLLHLFVLELVGNVPWMVMLVTISMSCLYIYGDKRFLRYN